MREPGEVIVDAIVSGGLVHSAGDVGVLVWSANSYEQITAIVEELIAARDRGGKRRVCRDEFIEHLRRADHVILNAIGFIAGGSIMSKQQVIATLVEAHKEIETTLRVGA